MRQIKSLRADPCWHWMFIRRLTTAVDRGTSFDLQAEVIWRRPLRRSFTRPSARALGVGEPLLSLFEACASSDDSGHSLKWRSEFESPHPHGEVPDICTTLPQAQSVGQVCHKRLHDPNRRL